jgi:hypothetical protein
MFRHSRLIWLAKTFVSSIQSHQNPDDGDRDGSRNVGLFLQPIDAAVSEEILTVEGCCKHERLCKFGFHIRGEFLGQLSDY